MDEEVDDEGRRDEENVVDNVHNAELLLAMCDLECQTILMDEEVDEENTVFQLIVLLIVLLFEVSVRCWISRIDSLIIRQIIV